MNNHEDRGRHHLAAGARTALVLTMVQWCACGAEETAQPPVSGRAPQMLLLESQATPWSPNGSANASPIVIPVCWVTPGWQAEKATMANAVQRTWGCVAPIDFTFADCSATSGDRIRVSIGVGDGGKTRYFGGYIDRYGRHGLRPPRATGVR